MVSEAKQKRLQETSAFGAKRPSIQQQDRNSTGKYSDKLGGSPTPKHNPTGDGRFSIPSDQNFMLPENIAFLIANAVQQMESKPVEVIANINNNFNIYGQI
jgi:hypothetical protein